MKLFPLLFLTVLASCQEDASPGSPDLFITPPQKEEKVETESPVEESSEKQIKNEFSQFTLKSDEQKFFDIPQGSQKIEITLTQNFEYGDSTEEIEEGFGSPFQINLPRHHHPSHTLSFNLSDCQQVKRIKRYNDKDKAGPAPLSRILAHLYIKLDGKNYPLNTKMIETKENRIVIFLERIHILESIGPRTVEVGLNHSQYQSHLGLTQLKGRMLMKWHLMNHTTPQVDQWWQDCQIFFKNALIKNYYAVESSGRYDIIGMKGNTYYRRLIEPKFHYDDRNHQDPSFELESFRNQFYEAFTQVDKQVTLKKEYKSLMRLQFF